MASTLPQDTQSVSPDIFLFGGFELDVGRRTLTFEGEPQVIGSRAFDVLAALARRGGDFVSNRDLVSIVWDRPALAEAALRVQIRAARQALKADPDVRIINATGRGYRLWPTPRAKSAAPEIAAGQSPTFRTGTVGELLVLRDASGGRIEFRPLYAGAPSHEILGLEAGEWPEHLSPAGVPFGARLLLVLGIARDVEEPTRPTGEAPAASAA